MKLFLISDNTDTQLGLRLSGIKGMVVHGKKDALLAIEKAVGDEEKGIIILTENLASLVATEINAIKLKQGHPLIVVIPDRHGMKHGKGHITQYIHETLGLEL